MPATKIQPLHVPVALPSPQFRLAHVPGHQTSCGSRTRGCRRPQQVPAKCWSLGTTSRPWAACARARPFHGRGELEVGKIVERVRSAPLYPPSAVVPRIYGAKSARAHVFPALDVLPGAAAGRWATNIRWPRGGRPAHRPGEHRIGLPATANPSPYLAHRMEHLRRPVRFAAVRGPLTQYARAWRHFLCTFSP